MGEKVKRLIGLLALMLLAGCITSEKGLAPDTVPFTANRTTFREVIASWGNPDSIKRHEAIWKTTLSNGGQMKAAYMFVGVTVSSSRVAAREYRLTFDEEGILRSWRICDSTDEGAPWTILPWF